MRSAPRKRKRWMWVALVVVVAAVVSLMEGRKPEWLRPIIAIRFPEVDWVDTRTLAEWMAALPAKRPLILDVRSQDEFAVSHLEGALRVDPYHPELESLHVHPDTRVVLYCSLGYRSAVVAERLKADGVEEVYNLTGGIFAWANEGRPIVENKTRATSVHPYNAIWGHFLRRPLRYRPNES